MTHLQALQDKHRRLDEVIREETLHAGSQDHEIRRLKEEKLLLKEQILEETRRIEKRH